MGHPYLLLILSSVLFISNDMNFRHYTAQQSESNQGLQRFLSGLLAILATFGIIVGISASIYVTFF